MLQGSAAGKSASQPLRATSAAQPKGCSGCSVPRAGTTSPKEMHFLPKSNPIRGQTLPAPPKKCISSPKITSFRDKLPQKGNFSPKAPQIRDKLSQPHRRNAFPPRNQPHSGTNSSQKGSFSPKVTQIRDKPSQPYQRNAFPPQKSPKSGTNPALEPELLCIKKPACVT